MGTEELLADSDPKLLARVVMKYVWHASLILGLRLQQQADGVTWSDPRTTFHIPVNWDPDEHQISPEVISQRALESIALMGTLSEGEFMDKRLLPQDDDIRALRTLTRDLAWVVQCDDSKLYLVPRSLVANADAPRSGFQPFGEETVALEEPIWWKMFSDAPPPQLRRHLDACPLQQGDMPSQFIWAEPIQLPRRTILTCLFVIFRPLMIGQLAPDNWPAGWPVDVSLRTDTEGKGERLGDPSVPVSLSLERVAPEEREALLAYVSRSIHTLADSVGAHL